MGAAASIDAVASTDEDELYRTYSFASGWGIFSVRLPLPAVTCTLRLNWEDMRV